MSLDPSDIIVIDTNALVHWIRQNKTGQHLMQHYALHQRTDRPLVSSIVEGEIRGLALYWSWGTRKLKVLDKVLSELVQIDAGLHDIVLSFAELYADDRSGGHNTGENDLWIAATAKATGAVLLTCDTDFGWMATKHIRVELVPPIP